MKSDVELNQIGVLQRREIEARILAPILEALGQAFGKEAVLEIAERTIVETARRQGRELVEQLGSNDLAEFASPSSPGRVVARLSYAS